MSKTEVTGRTTLLRIGISDINATMIIPYLFTSAMTTDPKSPQIILLVRALQQQLNMMSAGIIETGYLDRATSSAFTQLFGTRDWAHWAWSDIVNNVIAATQQGVTLAPVQQTPAIAATGDFTMPFGLPDVPGGILTYAVGAAALYYYLRKR